MKVLLVNGSPHRDGCTFTSLSEVAGALNKNGVESGKTRKQIRYASAAITKSSLNPLRIWSTTEPIMP